MSLAPGTLQSGGPQTDPRPSRETAGYKLNHLMLRIRDPARSLHFYKTLMGLRTIFTMNAGPFTMYYLGYPPPSTSTTTDDGPEHQGKKPAQQQQEEEEEEDLQTWAAHTSNLENLTQTPGLLELYHVHGTEKPVADGGIELSSGNDAPNLGFGHVGFTVPDVLSAVGRLRDNGVRVYKDVGDVRKERVPISEWEVARGVGGEEIHANYERFWRQIAYVLDPDGYIVELVPQNMQ